MKPILALLLSALSVPAIEITSFDLGTSITMSLAGVTDDGFERQAATEWGQETDGSTLFGRARTEGEFTTVSWYFAGPELEAALVWNNQTGSILTDVVNWIHLDDLTAMPFTTFLAFDVSGQTVDITWNQQPIPAAVGSLAVVNVPDGGWTLGLLAAAALLVWRRR